MLIVVAQLLYYGPRASHAGTVLLALQCVPNTLTPLRNERAQDAPPSPPHTTRPPAALSASPAPPSSHLLAVLLLGLDPPQAHVMRHVVTHVRGEAEEHEAGGEEHGAAHLRHRERLRSPPQPRARRGGGGEPRLRRPRLPSHTPCALTPSPLPPHPRPETRDP
eukprot:506374-Rhodomonas_salina.2